MIDQLIQMVTQKLGIDPAMAEKAVGIVMSLIQKEGDGAAVSQLFDNIPGAADLASKFSGSAGQDAAGGLLGKVAGMLGGGAGDVVGSIGALKETGLSMDQLGDMAPLVKNFLAENAGEDVVNQALSSVPALKGFLS